eukprot:gene21220-28131_t
MVCPLCVAAAITANAPAIAAAFGGVAALKLGLGSRDGAHRVSPSAYTTEEVTCQKTGRVARLPEPVIAKAPKLGPMAYAARISYVDMRACMRRVTNDPYRNHGTCAETTVHASDGSLVGRVCSRDSHQGRECSRATRLTRLEP